MTLKTIDKDLDGVTSCINLGTNPINQKFQRRFIINLIDY